MKSKRSLFLPSILEETACTEARECRRLARARCPPPKPGLPLPPLPRKLMPALLPQRGHLSAGARPTAEARPPRARVSRKGRRPDALLPWRGRQGAGVRPRPKPEARPAAAASPAKADAAAAAPPAGAEPTPLPAHPNTLLALGFGSGRHSLQRTAL